VNRAAGGSTELRGVAPDAGNAANGFGTRGERGGIEFQPMAGKGENAVLNDEGIRPGSPVDIPGAVCAGWNSGSQPLGIR
jgi:hypothetical protein